MRFSVVRPIKSGAKRQKKKWMGKKQSETPYSIDGCLRFREFSVGKNLSNYKVRKEKL